MTPPDTAPHGFSIQYSAILTFDNTIHHPLTILSSESSFFVSPTSYNYLLQPTNLKLYLIYTLLDFHAVLHTNIWYILILQKALFFFKKPGWVLHPGVLSFCLQKIEYVYQNPLNLHMAPRYEVNYRLLSILLKF